MPIRCATARLEVRRGGRARGDRRGATLLAVAAKGYVCWPTS
jgi:hypothetical protein